MFEGSLPNQHFVLKDKSFSCKLQNIKKHGSIGKSKLFCNNII